MNSIIERQTEAPIIVIGAGAAGLMAACTLRTNGAHVILLEARNRIGGRIYTLPNHGFSHPAEAGAEFIHGDLPITSALLESANIRSSAMQGKIFKLDKGMLKETDLFGNELEQLLRALKKLKTDMTLGEFLQQHFSGPEHDAFRESITQFVEGYNAADLARVSALALSKEWSQDEEPEQRRPVGGYGQLMEHLLKQALDQGVAVHLSSVVSRIRWQPGKAVVETTDGNLYSAQKVLVTVPIGVLQHEHITFTPEIPVYLQAAKDIGYGSVIKFLLEFKAPFWEGLATRPVHHLAFMLSDAAIPTWWTQLPDTTPLLTGWLGGPAAERLHASDDQLLHEALRSLSYIFDCRVEMLRQQLRQWHISDWKNDPFSCGAYSYATIETPRARGILNTPVADTIYFSGEAVYDGPHTGTVEAALTSGKEAAIKMMHAYSEEVEK